MNSKDKMIELLIGNSPRAQARKDLRDYDNPKGGRNKNYGNKEYLKLVELKWNKEEAVLREWVSELRKGKFK